MVEMIKLSDLVFKFLKNKGISCAFMLPGGGAMHLDDSLGKSGIDYYPFLHEQGAAIAAEAYAQHTNTPGLVVVTSGPGATNTLTAVVAGWIDSTPMIVISGQAKRADLVGDKRVRQIGSQEVNIIEMVKPITKYAVQVLDPNRIVKYLNEAWEAATTGRPGPVWLDIPLDVQATMLEDTTELVESHDAVESELSEDKKIKGAVEKTIHLLENCRKPLVLAGNGIKLAGAMSQFYEFVRKLGVPVQTTWKTIDFFDENDSLYVGHPGGMGDRGANYIIQQADLLISIGSRLDTSITAFNDAHFAMSAKKIIVDIDEYEIARMNMDKEVALACDAKVYLEELLEAYSRNQIKNDYSGWLSYCKNLRKQYPIVTDEHRNKTESVSPYYFIDRLCDWVTGEDVIVPESSGGAGEITYQAWRVKQGQKMKNAAGLGSMGFGLPYAIGSCLANKKRRTILINGDGAFQLNIQELETLHRMKLPVKIFVWSNDGYASIRAMQRKNFEGRYVGSDFTSGLSIPDMSAVAKAYGFNSFEIRYNKDVDKVLESMLKNDDPMFCTVFVDANETVMPRVMAYANPDGTISTGLLEDMTPIIPKNQQPIPY